MAYHLVAGHTKDLVMVLVVFRAWRGSRPRTWRREHAEGALRGALVAVRGRRRAAVRERDDVVALLAGRAHRGLDAAVREEAAEGHGLDLLGLERRFQIGAGEGVEALLAPH